MDSIEETRIQCPYCGEPIDILVDCSEFEQDYIEDCQVCCRPIQIRIRLNNEGDFDVFVRSEDDIF